MCSCIFTESACIYTSAYQCFRAAAKYSVRSCAIVCELHANLCVNISISLFLRFCHLQPPALALSPVHLSACTPAAERACTEARCQILSPVFQPQLSDDCSPLPLSNCFCGVHCGGCSIWFEAGRDRARGFLMCLCLCMYVCMRSHGNPIECVLSSILLLALMSQQIQAPEMSLRVQRADGDLEKGISQLHVPFIA